MLEKENRFFQINGVQELVKRRVTRRIAKIKVKILEKRLGLLRVKLSKDNPLGDSIDRPPFVLIHDDFDGQNILVETDNEIKIVGIVDWEFSRTGTLWDLCGYPIWIQEVGRHPSEKLTDAELEENREKKELRIYFHDKMVEKFGDISGHMLAQNMDPDSKTTDLGDIAMYFYPFTVFDEMVNRFLRVY